MSRWEELNDAEQGGDGNWWTPEEEGEMIIGTIVNIGSGESEYGEFHYVMLDIHDEDDDPTGEEIQFSFMGSVRANWFEKNRHKVEAGNVLGCRYDGEQSSSKGTYKTYTFRVWPAPNRADQLRGDDEGGKKKAVPKKDKKKAAKKKPSKKSQPDDDLPF